MKMRLKENADIEVVTGISDIIIDSINKKWDNIRDFNSIIVNLNAEGYEDMVPVIESILEDENRNVGKLQQLVELISPTAASIDEGRAEAIEELDGGTEVEEDMKLKEGYDNLPKDTQTVVTPAMGKAIEDKEEMEKQVEDALKENEKLANETIPKEGETGKKVTSRELKAMHLSESLFEDIEDGDSVNFSEGVFLTEGEGSEKKNFAQKVIKFVANKARELNMNVSDEDKIKFAKFVLESVMKYNKDHESVSKDDITELVVKLFKSSFNLDGEYVKDMKESLVEDVEEEEEEEPNSLKYDIAREQLKRFKEGKMPKGMTPKAYVSDLVKKHHLTREEGEQLLSEDYGDDLTSTVGIEKRLKQCSIELMRAIEKLHNGGEFDVVCAMVESLANDIQELNTALQKYEEE